MTYRDWVSKKVEICTSPVQGQGMFAKMDIKSGEKLVIWQGDYTDKVGAEKERAKGKLVMQWDDDLFSYEERGEQNGYFINHSCDPNMWMSDAYSLVARRDIEKDEELTLDYTLWEADENYIAKWECKCGSPLCRGRVTGLDWKKPELQKRYEGHFSPLLNKRIARLADKQ